MRCKDCGAIEVIKVNKPENVKFVCIKGHVWYEEYIDKGGKHTRPGTYEIKLEDVLFPSEKVLYNKVLDEIKKNQNFFTSSSTEDITDYLINKCKFNKEAIYKLFRKINKYGTKTT
jgi:hypothetical protein